LMASAPSNKEALVLPDRWAIERGIMARDALKAGKRDFAYQLASAPALDADSGTAFMDAEFLAGWIALQSLHKPDLALNHFDRLAKGVTYPISVARAHYWLGRTAEAMGAPGDALAEYRIAAQHGATFYGQLAIAKISSNPVLHVNAVASEPAPVERAAFEADDRVKAIRLLADLGDRSTMRLFALSIASDPPEPKRLQMLAELMGASGDPAMSLRVAKNASYSGVNLLSYLHPVMATPQLQMSGGAPEPALVLGLTRQESEFDPMAVSSAGARGLMQLMPASAKHAASMRGIAYRQNELTANPSYNMQLGMATIAEYLERWNGSYVMAIASYNAGPTNIRNWIETYGDPRDPGVDPIDWIESIPFPETRNYVQRVMENLEVYRNRLSNADQRLAILADLYRPSGVEIAAARPVPTLGPEEATVTPAAARSLAPTAPTPQ
jgi:soluble lytic murein transglycosylase